MAKKKTNTEVAASTDAAATPVENVQEQIVDTTITEEADTTATEETNTTVTEEADTTATEETDTTVTEEADTTATEETDTTVTEEADTTATEETGAKAKSGVFVHKGANYAFSKRTPAKLQTDEGLFTQEEILLNTELMQSLIESNCVFITQV